MTQSYPWVIIDKSLKQRKQCVKAADVVTAVLVMITRTFKGLSKTCWDRCQDSTAGRGPYKPCTGQCMNHASAILATPAVYCNIWKPRTASDLH